MSTVIKASCGAALRKHFRDGMARKLRSWKYGTRTLVMVGRSVFDSEQRGVSICCSEYFHKNLRKWFRRVLGILSFSTGDL